MKHLVRKEKTVNKKQINNMQTERIVKDHACNTVHTYSDLNRRAIFLGEIPTLSLTSSLNFSIGRLCGHVSVKGAPSVGRMCTVIVRLVRCLEDVESCCWCGAAERLMVGWTNGVLRYIITTGNIMLVFSEAAECNCCCQYNLVPCTAEG